MIRSGKKGFTLMEMLIVIAIIAILIAIAIPVFTSQLNKAKLSTDQSNARALKGLVTTIYLSETSGSQVKAGVQAVYYMNSTATGIQTDKSGALTCQGNDDDKYKDSTNGGDKDYVWVYWNGTVVTDTNPSLETAD